MRTSRPSPSRPICCWLLPFLRRLVCFAAYCEEPRVGAHIWLWVASLWWVNGIQPFVGWTGTPGGDEPVHAPRTIFENPQVLEFATPIAGTYPLWYDPAYWYEGAKARFNASQQIAALKRSLQFYVGVFNDLKYPIAGLAVLSMRS